MPEGEIYNKVWIKFLQTGFKPEIKKGGSLWMTPKARSFEAFTNEIFLAKSKKIEWVP